MERPDWLTARRIGVATVVLFVGYVVLNEWVVGEYIWVCGTETVGYAQAEFTFETDQTNGSLAVEVIHAAGDGIQPEALLVATGTTPLSAGQPLTERSPGYADERFVEPGESFVLREVEPGTRVAVGIRNPIKTDGVGERISALLLPCDDLPWRKPDTFVYGSTRAGG